MNWGEFKKKVEKDLKDDGCGDVDIVEIEYIDIVPSTSDMEIYYDAEKNEIAIW